MTFPEEADQEASAAPYKRQWSPLPWIAFAAAFGALAWIWRAVSMQNLRLGGLEAPRITAKTRSTESTATVEKSEVLSVAPAEPKEEPKADIQLYMVSHDRPRRRPPPAEPAATEWRLRGRVFDLTSLVPLGGVRLVFSDPVTDKRFETVTDDQGRYRTIVPPLAGRGYAANLSRDGYAPTYVSRKGLEQEAAESRLALARKLVSAVEPPSVLRPRDAKPLVTDFYLAPK